MIRVGVLAVVFLVVGWCSVILADATIELTTGAKPRGTIASVDAESITVEAKVGSRSFQRTYPNSKIAAVIVDGRRMSVDEYLSSTGTALVAKSKDEILEMINSLGKTPPDWYDETPLNYPQSLDLSWPEPAPKPWNNSKNVGQYIWDRINPNPGKWQEGVKLMHHIMAENRDDQRIVQRAMRTLGTMYHNLHEDYARAAFWYEKAGVAKDPSREPNAGAKLANAYFQLGSKEMAIDLMKRMTRRPYSVIKLLGDMGETDGAISTAEAYARNADAQGKTICYLYAGEACRLANRIDEAEKFFRNALDSAKKDSGNPTKVNRNINRAQANLAAIEFLRLDPSLVSDGTYRAASLGYEGDLEVEVVMSAGTIKSVKVTDHKEKQFYSSIRDTTRSIVEQQSLQTVDTTSGATITSEAIIHATAKALSQASSK